MHGIILIRTAMSRQKGASMRLNPIVRRLALISAIAFLAFSAIAQTPALPPTPPTAKHPVTDLYHGVKVTDDYRWLEDWNNPEVKQWSAAQNARSREYLDHLPSRSLIKQRLQQLISAGSATISTWTTPAELCSP